MSKCQHCDKHVPHRQAVQARRALRALGEERRAILAELLGRLRPHTMLCPEHLIVGVSMANAKYHELHPTAVENPPQ